MQVYGEVGVYDGGVIATFPIIKTRRKQKLTFMYLFLQLDIVTYVGNKLENGLAHANGRQSVEEN